MKLLSKILEDYIKLLVRLIEIEVLKIKKFINFKL